MTVCSFKASKGVLSHWAEVIESCKGLLTTCKYWSGKKQVSDPAYTVEKGSHMVIDSRRWESEGHRTLSGEPYIHRTSGSNAMLTQFC